MSRAYALAALDRMNRQECLIDPSMIQSVEQGLTLLASANKDNEQKLFTERQDQICEAYGYATRVQDKPFAFQDGVAIIPVHGTLLNRFNWSWGYVTGYNFIRWQMNAALDDEDVKMIVFDVNSPGGEAAGCFELANEIFKARGSKPLLAVVDSLSASAAYAISSACDKIYLIPSGRAGSIGVIAIHFDWSKAMEEFGVKVTMIFAGKHKADGNPYEPLPEAVQADLQKSIDKAYGQFVDLVAKNRGLDSQSIRSTEARVYRADDALEEGLIDAIKTPTDAVAAFLGELGDDEPTEEEDEDMKTAAELAAEAAAAALKPAAAAAAPAAVAPGLTAADVANAVATGIREDRERCAAIRGCEEAKGREALAQAYADEGMSVETAKRLLAAAPKAVAAAPAAEADALAAAMAGTPQPEVGADGAAAGGAGGGQPTSAELSAQILADQAHVTGRKKAA
jgi:signal peptide peptidase SppA